MDAAAQAATAAVDESIYTSAPKLLNGDANLGVVAATESFPPELDRFLRPLRSYSTPLELAPTLGGKPGERYTLAPLEQGDAGYVTFTRASFSSVAHLGRTTPIVQHVAVPASRLDAAGLRVADLVGWVAGLPGLGPPFAFVNAWQGDPKHLEPRALSRATPQPGPAAVVQGLPLPESLQSRLLGAICDVADALLDSERPQRSVFLVLPVDWQPHVPSILAAVLAALPSAVQKTLAAVTQAWDSDDVQSAPRLVVSHPGSPIVATMSRPAYASKAVVIDLTTADALTEPPPVDAGSRILPTDLTAWSREGGRSLPALFDEIDPLGLHKSVVLNLKRGIDHWLDSRSASALSAAHAAASACDAAIGAGGKGTVSAAEPLLRAIDVGCRHLIADNRWGELLALLDAPGLSVESYTAIEAHVSANIEPITEQAADLVARLSIESEAMERLLVRQGKNERFLIRWLAAMDGYTAAIPDRIGETAARFSRLGAPLLRAGWRRLRSVGLVPHAAATFTTVVVDLLIERVGRANQPKDESRPPSRHPTDSEP